MNWTPILAAAGILLPIIGGIILQRMSGRITKVDNTVKAADARAAAADVRAEKLIVEANDRAEAADKRAGEAETRAAHFRDELTKLWQQQGIVLGEVNGLRIEVGSLQRQLDSSKTHIQVLTDHIDRELGPPAPEIHSGMHWTGYQPPHSAGSANPPA